VKDWQMVTLFQIFGNFFFLSKRICQTSPLEEWFGISLSISYNLNDLAQIRVFYGKLLPKFPIQKA
jgi:hypothetical protein